MNFARTTVGLFATLLFSLFSYPLYGSVDSSSTSLSPDSPLFCRLVSWVDRSASPAFKIDAQAVTTQKLGSYTARVQFFSKTRSFGVYKTSRPTMPIAGFSDRYETESVSVQSNFASLFCDRDETQLLQQTEPLIAGIRLRSSKPLTSSIVHIATHPTSDFDQGLTRVSSRRLQTLLHMLRVPTVMLSHVSGLNENYYLKPTDYSKFIFSPGGAHRLSFAQPKTTVILSGGFLDLCLCETLRDVVRTASREHQITVVIATEATTASDISDFEVEDGVEDTKPSVLAPLIEKSSHAQIMNFVSNRLWGQTDQGPMPQGYLCSFQSSERDFSALRSDQFTLQVFRTVSSKTGSRLEPLGQIGAGRQRVRLIFAKTKDLRFLIH